ncbi:M28 family peptidase [Blastococcus sp. CCUG 61487]|uniref:M28 family peptidase n=1 Tax=Blastococcus sp. CCUG 61487 TaxID=1840703 RepID=UPI0010BFECF5|nr:M28 family peptidase [Blastococcus sp. CCUG 61487]TKJ18198.1 hypothetical protein A6V29_12000 [Blastococcus sp. CCUG 61487]
MPSGRAAHWRPSRAAGGILLAVLVGLGAWSVGAIGAPDPRAADAPATDFSASRALEHVQRIAGEPHVPGSEAADRVVDDLVATLTALGLDTRVQNAVGAGRHDAGRAELGRVRNVVAVLPGTESTGRLLLLAHHDSTATGPGAADAVGVATVLETVRALSAGPPLRNDVLVVLTDGETACACGAEAFAASHPLAQDGGVVLSVEARGSRGRPVLLATSRGAADLTTLLAGAASHVAAGSAAVELHRRLDDGPGANALLEDPRYTGFRLGLVDGTAARHTAQDLPDRLDPGALQALGDDALAVARALGGEDLLQVAGEPTDATLFPVLGRQVHWSATAARPLAVAVLALVAVGGLGWLSVRRGFTWPRLAAAGTALAAVPLVLGPLAVVGLWRLLVAVRPGYGGMADPWRPGWYRLAAVVLVLAVVLAWYALLRRRFGETTLLLGGLAWVAVLAVVLAVVAPGAAYLAALPVLAGAAAGAVCAVTTSPAVRVGAAFLGGAVAVVLLAPALAVSFPALGLSAGVLPGLVATALALALLPALELVFPDPDEPRVAPVAVVPLVALVVAGACALVGLQVDRFDVAHPQPSRLAYALDTDGRQAWWVSPDPAPGGYAAGYVDRRGELTVDFPYLAGRQVAFGSAAPAGLAAARVETVHDAEVGGRRELTVRVTPQRPGVRLMALHLSAGDGTVARAKVAGRGVGEDALGGSSLELLVHAPPADGVEASFSIEGGAAVTLRVVDGSDGLDGLPGHAPRPDGVTAAGSPESDLLLVSGTTSLG